MQHSSHVGLSSSDKFGVFVKVFQLVLQRKRLDLKRHTSSNYTFLGQRGT